MKPVTLTILRHDPDFRYVRVPAHLENTMIELMMLAEDPKMLASVYKQFFV